MVHLSDNMSISGELGPRDLKRLTQAMRGATVGPTTLYYAGVTAPIIGAGMGLLTRRTFGLLEMSTYWQTMGSAICAAMAGIVWYLIFMRWSYRHHHGRSNELAEPSVIALSDDGMSVQRGKVETRIDWLAVTDLKVERKFLLIRFDGADPVIVPNRWFDNDNDAREAFCERIEKASRYGTQQS